MLRLALRARLPMIAVQTTDPTNVERVLRHYAKSKTPIRKLTAETKKIGPTSVFYAIGKLPKCMKPNGWGGWFQDTDSSLIVVNPEVTYAMAYDAGPLQVPQELIRSVLADALAAEDVDPVASVCGGLTLTEVLWAVSLASVKHGGVSSKTVADVRRTAFPPRSGLAPVECSLTGYLAPAQLAVWLKGHAPFFHDSPDERLKPRGLLFDGPSGTGKTMGAKFLAVSLGVPLFRLAFEQVKDKWVGSTEKQLAQALAHAEAAAPCVLLVDEIEKLMSGHASDSSGTTGDILAALLWWLQEHQSKVLTVMTTNNVKSIPEELHRPGRIDSTLLFEGLREDDGQELAMTLVESYALKKPLDPKDVSDMIHLLYTSRVYVPHAEIAQGVASVVRAHLLRTEPGAKRTKRIRVHKKKRSARKEPQNG